MDDYILEMQDITKEFSGVKALKNVDFKVKRGEIHALCGENGAGKSTLMKIISGVYAKDTYQGKIIYNGEEKAYAGIKDSESDGIVIIYQELNIVKSLNVYENIFLGNEIKNKHIIDKNKEIIITNELMERVGLKTTPDTGVTSLGVGKQQLIEIAKALNKNAKLLILDEPTAPLTEVDSKNLFRLLNELRRAGVTCIYISHKLDEIFEIADTITVLRDGETIITEPTNMFDMNKLITNMVGRELVQQFPPSDHKAGKPRLQIKNWSVKNPDNPEKMLLEHINLEAREGEILGISGLVGAGRSELAMSIFGALEAKSEGEIYIDNEKIDIRRPEDAIKAGLCYLSEDRKRYGLVLEQDIKENMSLASLKSLRKRILLDKNKEIIQSDRCVEQLKIKLSSLMQSTKNLSGGNQQKVVIAKWLLTNPKIFILDEPTRGVDVGAKYEIYTTMNELVDKGVCIIMISSELPEILGMSDRICVIHEGKITGMLDKKEATQEKLLYLAAGGSDRE
ncbi:ABC-type sugar transport system ATPase subunit [Lachnospiraceae bacterium PF1-22]|uniref:sugar ABC transporter ATP-binding protein n=1 Tax=Ohessyouella blattaphilus TaxID=2949333 RepID=UPI003E20BAA5